ncbi:MAG: outer membrane protein assembly factor BamA [Bacteroidaceae bacterium]|nr:outer membrane protein assembly factor BamA [Bacteroidaceae bacterium]
MKKSIHLLKIIALTGLLVIPHGKTTAQIADTDTIASPSVLYSAPKRYEIAGITVSGVDNYEDYVLIGLSGLSIGQVVTIPGEEITAAVKRYWKHGLFSNVSITVEKAVGNQAYLNIALTQRPRLSKLNFNGVKKSEQEDLEAKLSFRQGNQITPNMIDRAKIVIKRYFDEKGFKNAEVNIIQRDDVAENNSLILDINIDKKEKIKVNKIYITGNSALEDKQLKWAMKKTNEKGNWRHLFRPKKFIDNLYEEDKQLLIAKYNEHGYRDAHIVVDSVVTFDDKTVDVYIQVEEGDQYHIRNINWVGNTVYDSEGLAEVLRMKPGDVYNQKMLEERINVDDDAIGNLYYNNGYVFARVEPVEVNVTTDSVDLEMRVLEGPQATINRVRIAGNDRLYENVVRRELMTKPGDLFSKDALMRSAREIQQMGHFNPEAIAPDVQPDLANGTVDINWMLESKNNDQVEFSLGYGQTGVIGKIALKFTNFSMYNLFHKSDNYRAFIPQGDGQTFTISGQTNGSYYQSYNISFFDPWFGGKRPNSFSVNAFFSLSTGLNNNFYNTAMMNNYYNSLYGYGYGNYNNYYNNYESYYDPDKYLRMYGLSLGWGKRLHWPDDYFTLYGELSYTRYDLNNWEYFIINNGSSNSISLSLNLGRSSIDNPIFPRQGSEISFNVSLTPPYSLFDGIDYKSLSEVKGTDANYNASLRKRYNWIEYHKWKFKSKFYTALTNGQKCLVLMARADFGLLGHYNKYKKSPFETFFVGGDGMSGYSYNYYTDMVALRGYDNGALTPMGQEGYAYSRFAMELRYPLMFENSTQIYALAFLEGGNAWTDVRKFNPFDMKRSAGVGVRIFLPMIGLMGIDWAYGFDKINGSTVSSGSQFHFILGQEF